MNGTVTEVDICTITEDALPVCLVYNGTFFAVAVAFDEAEFSAFARDDGRSKLWFMVPRIKLREVSNLADYEPKVVQENSIYVPKQEVPKRSWWASFWQVLTSYFKLDGNRG